MKQTLYNGNSPPSLETVKIYFSQKGMKELEAEHFYIFYEMKQWRSSKGNLFKNWKSLAHGWIMSALRMQPWLFNRRTH
jgi:hypothetical protein